MSFGYINLGSSAKMAIQIKVYSETLIDPPLNEMELAICDYIQENVSFPIFKNYSPEDHSEEGIWSSILITDDFVEIEKFLKENHLQLKNYRIIHAQIGCRRNEYPKAA